MSKYLINSNDIEIENVSGTDDLKFNFVAGNSLETSIGDLSNLNTTDKTDLVSAINEVNGNLTNLNTYSTSETIIGTWINGKTIYRKVINCSNLPNNTTKLVNHNISNLEFVIKLRLMCITGSIFYEANLAGTTGIFNGGIVAIRADATQVEIGTTFDATQHVGYAIIEYTKS